MLVDSKTKGQIKITLSAVEICDWFGSFKDIRYDNKKSRAALGALLLAAMDSSDFKLTRDRLFIKVLPTESGGCDIFFTLGNIKRLYRIAHNYIYEFACCDDMLSACSQLRLNGAKNATICIFHKGGKYRILLDESRLCKNAKRILAEYSVCCYKDDIIKNKTQEYWQKICENTPVKKLL